MTMWAEAAQSLCKSIYVCVRESVSDYGPMYERLQYESEKGVTGTQMNYLYVSVCSERRKLVQGDSGGDPQFETATAQPNFRTFPKSESHLQVFVMGMQCYNCCGNWMFDNRNHKENK